MVLVAAVATALAALGAALAVGGWQVGPLAIAPALYALAFVPGLMAVAAGRVPPALPKVDLPPAAVRIGRFVLLGLVLGLVAAKTMPEGVAGAVTTAAGLGAVGMGLWWPRPLALRASVALAVLSLARPGADPRSHVAALVLMGAAAAVSLVASSHLSAASAQSLGGVRASRPARRLAVEAAPVALALLAGAFFAARMDAPRPSQGQAQPGDVPRPQQPDPLAFSTTLDPSDAGRGRRGGDPDTVLLKVDSDRPGVLRTVTFDEWDGRRWRRSHSMAGRPTGGGFVPVFGDEFESLTDVRRGRPPEFVEQRVRIEATYAAVAPATPQVHSFDLPGMGWVGSDGTVQLSPALGRGAAYTAQSTHVDATPAELRSAMTGLRSLPTQDGRSLEVLGGNPFVAADPALSERARALAARLTAGAPTAYDKVSELSLYFAARVTVDDDVAALPAGTDPIDSVLFDGKAVSPERLATTLAVLTRAIGVPSRLAMGFLPGERPFFGGDFAVRARDAHLWVEVPFAGIGWQRFDPSGRIEAAERQDSLWSRLKRAWERYRTFFVLATVLLVAFVVRLLIRRRRRLAAVPWATRYFARLARLGRERGRPRRSSETPAEYTAALAGGVLADERLVEVGRVVTAAKWSGRDPDDGARRWAELVLEEAARAGRRRRVRVGAKREGRR